MVLCESRDDAQPLLLPYPVVNLYVSIETVLVSIMREVKDQGLYVASVVYDHSSGKGRKQSHHKTQHDRNVPKHSK